MSYWSHLPAHIIFRINAATEDAFLALRLARTCRRLWYIFSLDTMAWHRLYLECWQPCDLTGDDVFWFSMHRSGTGVTEQGPRKAAEWRALLWSRYIVDQARHRARPSYVTSEPLPPNFGITWRIEIAASSDAGVVYRPRPGHRLLVIRTIEPASKNDANPHTIFELMPNQHPLESASVASIGQRFVVASTSASHPHSDTVAHYMWSLSDGKLVREALCPGSIQANSCHAISGGWYMFLTDQLLFIWHLHTGQTYHIPLPSNHTCSWANFLATSTHHATLYLAMLVPPSTSDNTDICNLNITPSSMLHRWQVWSLTSKHSVHQNDNSIPQCIDQGNFWLDVTNEHQITTIRMSASCVLVCFTSPRQGLAWRIYCHDLKQRRLVWKKNTGKCYMPIPLVHTRQLILVPTLTRQRWFECRLTDGTECRTFERLPPTGIVMDVLRGISQYSALTYHWRFNPDIYLLDSLLKDMGITLEAARIPFSLTATTSYVMVVSRAKYYLVSFMVNNTHRHPESDVKTNDHVQTNQICTSLPAIDLT